MGSNQFSIDLGDLPAKYLASRKREVPVLTEALEKRDYTTIRILGHRMKGNAVTFGFPVLGPLGADLEDRANAEDPNGVQMALNQLIENLATLNC